MSLEKSIRDMFAPKEPTVVEAKEQKIHMFKTKAEADKKAKEIGGKVVPLTKQNFAVVKEDMNEAKEIDPDDKGEYDNEGQMALTQLATAEEAIEDLMGIIKKDDNLPEWVQSKLTKAVDYMDSVRDYLVSKSDEDDDDDDEEEKGEVQEAVETTHVVIDTADGNKVVATASSEQGAKSSITSAERPPMNIKNKRTLKIVKLKKPVGDKQVDRMVGYPLKEEFELDEEKSVRQLINPNKEVMVVKMIGKQHKVVVIDKSKQKEYLSKGWLLAEETQLDESVISDIKDIVAKKSAKKIQGVMVDLFTASAISQIYDKVNDANKAKMDNMKVTQLANLAMKMMKREEAELDEARSPSRKEIEKVIAKAKNTEQSVDAIKKAFKVNDKQAEELIKKLFEGKLDKVNPVAVKKDFKNRKDKDIDNDGDVDDSDEYLHKRRKAISKAVKEGDDNANKTDKSDMDDNGVLKKKASKDGKGNKGGEPIEINPSITEQEMSDDEMKKVSYFKEKYGKRWEKVMNAAKSKTAQKK